MKNKILFALIFGVMIMFSQKVFASELCSSNGYTVLTINGVFTNEQGALLNKNALQYKLSDPYKNEQIYVDYLYNPSHLAGTGDIVDAVVQGVFDQKSDYDLVEMLNSTSEKVKTQKVLLVGHSQGNFYANSFYNKVIDKEGGIPSKSIGVYSVATPANYVSGGGKYLTSDTDLVISSLVSKFITVLPSNTHINWLKEDDKYGHSFSDVYLKYKGDQIISDIKFSLNKLKSNQIQNTDSVCISPQKITTIHKVQGAMLAVADPTAIVVRDGIIGTYNAGSYIANATQNIILAISKNLNNLLASAIGSTSKIDIFATAPLNTGDTTEIITDGDKDEKIISTPEPVLELEKKNEIPTIIIPDINPDPIIYNPIYRGGGSNSGSDQEIIIPTPEEIIIPPVNEEVVPPVVPQIIPSDPEPKNNLTIDEDTIWNAGEYNYDNILITNNSKLILESDQNSLNEFKGVKIIAKNITIDSGSSISADRQGYVDGPGAPSLTEYFAGANYGGVGHRNTLVPIYGSATNPIDLGSGGANNFRGGGAMQIIISETLLNNGVISANGDATSSGGSLYITSKNISGSGVFSANGGGMFTSGVDFGTGGGGRIAIYYENLLFSGKTEAFGGCGQYDGMTKTCSKNGTVGLFDTLNNNLLVTNYWLFQKNDSPFNFNKIIVDDGAIVVSEKETNITSNELIVDNLASFTFAKNQNINIPIINIKGISSLVLSGEENIITDIISLSGKSNISIIPEKIFSLTTTNLNIEDGSSISVDGKGYIDGLGIPPTEYGGASYGGFGGRNIVTSIYGDAVKPIDFGSGGYGSFRGGGAVRIIVLDNLINNGVISANGDATSSGGSLYITSKNISGSGVFSANGGGMYCGGICVDPGGGGRIAIYYGNNLFTGKILVDGATPGTIQLIDNTIPILSSEKLITSFNFESLTPKVIGEINNIDYTIKLKVLYGTDVLNLIPTVLISNDKSSVIPTSLTQSDFTDSVEYIVTAEDGTTLSYEVMVEVLPNSILVSDPISVYILPTIDSYLFNGAQDNITINPLVNNLSFVINSNKKVNWMSVKIEKEENNSVYRIFQSDTKKCVEWTSTCEKLWIGELKGDIPLQSGIYKIRVHIKDEEGKEYEEYLPSVINVNIE